MIEKTINLIFSQLRLFFVTIGSLGKVLIRSKFRLKLPKARTQKCYILGNGPSLSSSLEKLNSELYDSENVLFAVNSFSCSPIFISMKPENYVFLDPYFSNYDGIETPIESVKKTYEHLISDVNWPLTLFVPASTLKNPFISSLPGRNPNIKLQHYNYVVFDGYEKVKFSFFKRDLAMPQCQNILAACIFIATNMQFKEIRILGADHSWHEQITVDAENNVITQDKHFYNQQGKTINMKTRSFNSDDYGIHSFFSSLSKAFYSYKILARYARFRNVRVINASEKSYIDAFDRL